ncbi:hypothetical transcript [Echinococcus multilocularis]|uniref:Hypothetical transcript n=1 Tax=Echinococcus multilocularis TaxID=6211 RepID=A0A0S4MJE2_ECHMU|nr:hypothetical transcript [Echinococcus multilocularis]
MLGLDLAGLICPTLNHPSLAEVLTYSKGKSDCQFRIVVCSHASPLDQRIVCSSNDFNWQGSHLWNVHIICAERDE